MANRIIIAGVVVLVVLALLPAINDIITNSLIPIMNRTFANTTLPMTGFELATWRFIPLALLIFAIIGGLAVLIRGRGVKTED